MEEFSEYLRQIDDVNPRQRLEEVFGWISSAFPDLKPRFAWNQPMFTDHGTFIIGFSTAKQHMAVAPERQGMERFQNEIAEAGYAQSKMLLRIGWDQPVNYALLKNIIRFNCLDKADCKTFWRK